MQKYTYYIYDMLKKNGRKNKCFHMPGHKSHGDFKRKFKNCPADITELSYSDNLICPVSDIARAQADLATLCGAEKSFILTDGSTSGVYTMVACVGRGKKLIVPRNSHKSVFTACALCGIEPITVRGQIKEGVMLPPAAEEIARLIESDKDIVGMLALSPDYYGNIAPLNEYADVLHARGKFLFCDGAHGAHLAFNPERKGYCGRYADMWVDGAHKTLPVLTQGALLNVKNKDLITRAEEAVRTFRTTSPSYPVMASVEYGYKYVANNLRKLEAAKRAVEKFKKESGYPFYDSEDWTKLLLDLKGLDICADKAAKELEKRGIYAELSDGRYILFYLSPSVRYGDLKALKRAIDGVLKDENLKGTYSQRPEFICCAQVYGFLNAVYGESEEIPLEKAAGRICARSAGVMPPCIPVALPGEVITPQAVKLLSGDGVFGVTDGKIAVVKKERV